MTITKTLLKTLKRDKEFLIIGIKENNTDLLIQKYDLKSKEITRESYDIIAKIIMRIENNRRFMRDTQIELNLLTELIKL